jgi:hypothetical protein
MTDSKGRFIAIKMTKVGNSNAHIFDEGEDRSLCWSLARDDAQTCLHVINWCPLCLHIYTERSGKP